MLVGNISTGQTLVIERANAEDGMITKDTPLTNGGTVVLAAGNGALLSVLHRRANAVPRRGQVTPPRGRNATRKARLDTEVIDACARPRCAVA